MDVLGLAALNRATLARQMLLARENVGVVRALERLLAIQAQWPKPPFIALFSRLAGFDREELNALARTNAVVRGTAFRATIFLMTPADYAAFRGTIQPTLDRGLKGITARVVPAEEHAKIIAKGRAFFAKRPSSFDGLREHLAKGARPTDDVRRMAFVVRMRVPLLQVATDVPWGWHAACDFALADAMIDAPIAEAPAHDALVLRYLTALGPATVADAQNFTGVTGLKAAFDRLRPKLVTFHDDRKRELFDLPKAPRPDPETAAPVRFLPDFDNVVMGHADRRRFVAEEDKPFVYLKGLVVNRTYLVDGRASGTWKSELAKKVATLVVEPIAAPGKKARAALEEEGEMLVRFLEPEAKSYALRFEKPRR